MCVSAAAVCEVLTEGRQRGPLRGVHGAIKDRDHGTCSDGGDLDELVGCVSSLVYERGRSREPYLPRPSLLES
jgi:hypothetical protein